MRSSIALVAAAALVVGMGAPAQAYDVQWRDSSELPGDGQVLAVDQADGDVLAMTVLFQGSQVVRRLDGRTGAVEWSTEVTGGLTSIEVDPTDGRVVLVGAYQRPLRMVVLDRDGQVLRDEDTGIAMSSVADLEVDPESGLACALGPVGGKRDASGWVTSCWDRSGALTFSRGWRPQEGLTIADKLLIDAERDRVYVAGTTRRVDRARSKRQDLVLLSYDTGGALRWQKRKSGVVFPSRLEAALDPARGRIHVLAEPTTIRQPTQLFSFDTRGRSRFVRSYRDVGSTFESAVAVTPKGDVVAVVAAGDRTSIRTYRPSGRLRTTHVVRTADRGNPGSLIPQVAIDPVRGRVHVVNDRGLARGAVLWSFNAAGRRTSSVLVDTAKSVFAVSIALHADSGRVVTSTHAWREGLDQLVSVRP